MNRMVNEDVVIVDESSMIGCKLFRDIFTQVRPDATLVSGSKTLNLSA